MLANTLVIMLEGIIATNGVNVSLTDRCWITLSSG